MAGAGRSSVWIESPAYDLGFLILAPLVTLPIVVGALAGLDWLVVGVYALSFAHYLSTFTFYFWPENREYHRARWMAFFAGPLILALVYVALAGSRGRLVVPFVLVAWNTYHVARQSCGIVSIYRTTAGVSDPVQKRAANTAIILTSVWLVLWNIESHRPTAEILQLVTPEFPAFLWYAVGAVALAALARLGIALGRRMREGRPLRVAELGALVVGLSLFHPYVWLDDSEKATFVMLIPHYVQYLGLVWLLHRRKFARSPGMGVEGILGRLSHNVPLLILTLGIASVPLTAVQYLMVRGDVTAYFRVPLLLLAFLHFYLDALIWAFKHPHVRRTIGRHLVRPAGVAGGAPALITPAR